MSERREARAESHGNPTAITELFVFTDKQHLSAQVTEFSSGPGVKKKKKSLINKLIYFSF